MSFHVNFDYLRKFAFAPLSSQKVAVLQCPFTFANIKRTTFVLVIHSPQHLCSVIAGMSIFKLCMERTKSYFVTKIHTSTIVQQNKVTQCSNVNFHMLLSTWLTPGTNTKWLGIYQLSTSYMLDRTASSVARKDANICSSGLNKLILGLLHSSSSCLWIPCSQYAIQYINVVLCQSMVNEEDKFLSCHTSQGYC